MSLFHGFGFCAVIASACWLTGCRASSRVAALPDRTDLRDKPASVARQNAAGQEELDAGIQSVGHLTTSEMPVSDQLDGDNLFAGADELSLDALIAAVHARNPSMHAAQAAWSAAAERYPQVIALEDPMLQTMFAPATFPSSSPVESSYYLGMAQRVPWQGKRTLRGQMAQWDAQSASWDTEEVKLRLAAASRMAYFDFFLAERELELNLQNVELMQDFRATAKTKYEANQVSEQDLSAADLELAKLQQMRLELEQARRIAIARINTLLHQRPDKRLPSPPHRLATTDPLPDASMLRQLAVEHRPELASLSAKIQSEQNAVALACKDYYPDFEFMGRYDSFWTDKVQRPQVGMNMNVPLNRSRRGAAVREAQFRLSKLMAEQAQQQDVVCEEVQIAHSRVLANQQAVYLYEDRILPAAQTNLDAARAAYIAGSIDFLRLMEARKQSTEQQIAYQQKLTEYHRSRTELLRSVGTEFDQHGPTEANPTPTETADITENESSAK